jgi:hypothetical protein
VRGCASKGSFVEGEGSLKRRAAHPNCPRNGVSWFAWVVALVLLLRAMPNGGKLPRAWLGPPVRSD